MKSEKKVVIITGAAGGIGLSLSKTFLLSSYKVILLDKNQSGIDSAMTELDSEDISGYIADVTNEDKVREVMGSVYKTHGRIDVLVNNAGLQAIYSVEDFPTERFRLMIEVMLVAPFIAIKHVLPFMKRKGFGRIINMASVNGLVGFVGKAAYNSAKHGLIGLTKVVALETAESGITVNALCPGYVDTPLVQNQLEEIAEIKGVSVENVLGNIIFPLVPQKRLLNVQEIADYALFLSSEKAAGITGQAVVIDGGYTVQ